MSEEYKEPSNKVRPVYQGPNPDNTPENRQPIPTQPSASDVFLQGRPPNEQREGQITDTRPGQTSDRQEVGSQEHSIKEASEAYVNEPRDQRPLKKGETK